MIEKLKNNKLFIQIFRFCIVGGIAFLVDYGILVFCKEVLHFNVLLSAGIGFCISVIFNYWASINWVFDVSRKHDTKRNFVLFIIFSVIGLILTEIMMYLGTDILKINYLIVKIFSTIVVMVFNFITRKLFLEKRKI